MGRGSRDEAEARGVRSTRLEPGDSSQRQCTAAPTGPCNPTPGYSGRIRDRCPNTATHTNVHSSISPKSRKVEIALVSIS